VKKYKCALFDLDGTLSDPKVGVFNSIIYACEKWNIRDYTVEELYSFIGPPLHYSFQRRFNLSKEDAAAIVKDYRVYYEQKGKFENVIYPGILDLLKDLKAAGITVGVATSKPTHFSVQIMEKFGLAPYIDALVGSNLDNTMSEKKDIIEAVLLKLNSPDKSATVMIGDRMFDIDGAKANGIDSIGVMYGYGSAEEFNEHKPNYIADTVEDLRKILL
jgi:phosphoglycolate phosphatase